MDKLRIQNFQAHKDLVVDLTHPVTTIVGPSDTGKSAIVRALRWFVMNKPSGTSFIKEGTKGTKVSIKSGDKVLSKIRTASKNQYVLKDKNEEQVFEAFGNEIPEPILQELNMGPLNFQFQHDSPFWFSETAGEVSRQLNQIVNLGIIDSSMKSISSSVRKSKTLLDLRKKEHEEAQQRFEASKWIPECVQDFTSLSEQQEELEEVNELLSVSLQLVEQIQKHISIIEENKSIQDQFSPIQEMYPDLEDTYEQIEDITLLCDKIESLQEQAGVKIPSTKELEELTKELEETTLSLRRIKYKIEQAKENESKIFVPHFDHILDLEEKYKEVCGHIHTYSNFIKGNTLHKKYLKLFEEECAELEQELKNRIGDTCPLCGNPQ